ncbi:MAG: DEAD/DEAH box helicase family protein [Ktedonobacterales bacterium]
MTPEDQARQQIDDLLAQCGWVVLDRQRLNLGAGRGIAVREFSLRTGDTDYLLFVDREAVGTVEAKKVGETLTGVEEQSAKYRVGLPAGVRANREPLPFTYETTGIETRFTSLLDPMPRSRQVFAFHRPETLAAWLAQAPATAPDIADHNDTMRALLGRLPPLERTGLRDCQFEAITNLERSLAANRPRALVQMATGSGKTYMAVSSVYRLLRYGGAQRVLFLVDRGNLAKQTLNEFQQFTTPDTGRVFTELYNVQRLQGQQVDPVARVCISTIQRLYSLLSGEAEPDDTLEEQSLFELDDALADKPPKEVRYNPAIPIETFDVIITDECHRSIYNLWRGVLDYFDAFTIGLTATPNKQAFGYFHRNLVMEYGHDRAVADGVNVDYQVYRIKTAITEHGSTIEKYLYVDRRDRQTRARRWEQLDDDLTYAANQLDRDVVAPDQIRKVICAFRDGLPEMFPGRTEVPKTLVFAKDDSHADDIVQTLREEFGAGNDFARKITYRTTGVKPEDLIAQFRNSYYPRIAVTVDMISTGTDIKPLEALLFMRSVKSRTFFEQMKGRGSRVIGDSDFQAVTPDASSKTHFVLIDAVGVCERIKTDDPPLERKPSVAFGKLLDAVATGATDDDTLASLAGRLGRLAGRLTPDEEREIRAQAGGHSARELAEALVMAIDPDQQLAAAQAATGQQEPDAQALRLATKRLVDEATRPFDNPDLREALRLAQQRDAQIIDTVSADSVTFAGWDPQAEDQARAMTQRFGDFLRQHQDEIAALQALYSRPRSAQLHLSDLRKLAAEIAAPPLGLTTDMLWQAYARLDGDRVRGANARRLLTDLVALTRYALTRERDAASTLLPYGEQVEQRYRGWLAEQEAARGRQFTPEQRQWLDLICEQVKTSLSMERDDFDYDPFIQRGGLGKAYDLFGADLTAILAEMNERLIA